ncbi:MAG: MmgE/PrpD family protein [Acidobacteriota bacterium]
MDAETVRIFRPTGITGPTGASVAGAHLFHLDEDASVSALALAANSTVGLNEWPRYGADDMYFHVGFAARNAVTCVELAELGAHGSETALDGAAGLFAALRRSDRVDQVHPFERDHFEILDVFHKPAGACNYAQTATQAALQLATTEDFTSRDIANIRILCTDAALNYPGCNAEGPFARVLQAKMSIRFCVAATLANAGVEETNFRNLQDPEIERLVASTILEADPALTAALSRSARHRGHPCPTRWPRTSPPSHGPRPRHGIRHPRALRKIRHRRHRRAATIAVAGMIDNLEKQDNIGALAALLQAK